MKSKKENKFFLSRQFVQICAALIQGSICASLNQGKHKGITASFVPEPKSSRSFETIEEVLVCTRPVNNVEMLLKPLAKFPQVCELRRHIWMCSQRE